MSDKLRGGTTIGGHTALHMGNINALMARLEGGFASADHTHTEYAKSSHSHDDSYAAKDHTHTEYAKSSHSHNYLASTKGAVLNKVALSETGQVGTYAYLRLKASLDPITQNAEYSGSLLLLSGNHVMRSSDGNDFGIGTGSAVSGTWRAMGHINNTTSKRHSSTLFLRIR